VHGKGSPSLLLSAPLGKARWHDVKKRETETERESERERGRADGNAFRIAAALYLPINSELPS